MSPAVSQQPAGELPPMAPDQFQVLMMGELFVRTRESALVGFLPVLLIAWAHWHAQPRQPLLIWIAVVVMVLVYRVLVAHLFLSRPDAQTVRRRRWFWLEWLGAVGLAAVWVGSLTLLGSSELDALFFLRLIFLVTLASFLLSAIGIDLLLYASFLLTLVAGSLTLLHIYYPGYVAQFPVVTVGFIVYAGMLLVRSRGEYRRTRDWIMARLTEKRLLDQLNQTILHERETQEVLRIKSIELEDINRQLGELAIRDALTGAFRRGHIEAELRRLVKGLQRRHADFSILLLDIDFFKRVNDQHGHAVGDEVLRRMAALVQSLLRGSDMFGRWGGEEFIVLMPDTTLAQALEAAERVRQAIPSLEFAGESGRFHITVSIGVAQYQTQETADALTGRADKALYAAKHAGRDRVMAYEPGQSMFSPLR
jgi:diguanylate cyclase (GGDEF)-like protein